jgi:mono/diheme cytochrome c family protein
MFIPPTFSRGVALAIALLAGSSGAAEVAGIPGPAEIFFEDRCIECHDADTQRGGLDLSSLGPEMGTLEQTALWTRIFDRVKDGEMPPKSRRRPDPEEIATLLEWISPRLAEADRAHREVVLRRLNRVEYQNTVRDLLGTNVELASLLPADQKAGGFDNNGAALALSTEQLQAYMKAAGVAIDAVLQIGKKPWTETKSIQITDSVAAFAEKYPGPDFAVIDGRAASFKTEKSTYSQLSTRSEKAKEAGWYRIAFEVVALNTEDPVAFSVMATDYAPGGAIDRNVGYYEADSRPRVIELMLELPKSGHLQFFPLGLPVWIHDRTPGAKHPGIAFGKVEMTGPLVDAWPPESYVNLLAQVDPDEARPEDARKIVEAFLPRAFRRPAETEEIERYTGLILHQLSQGRDFLQSVRAGLIGILCSPNFLYLREDVREEEGRISDYELASRLTYFLWSSMPDEELLRLAGEGKLREPGILQEQTERLLRDVKGREFVRNFTGQWLHLREINDTTPDEKLYKDFDELLQYSMVAEGEAFFREILENDLPISNFLDSDFAMLNGRLAAHYGIEGVKGIELRKVELPEGSVRGGVITQAGVLKVTANGTNTSPILRGVWVLENILGKPTPPPPPNIQGIEPDIRGAVTIRQQLEKHRDDPSCNSCHQYIDPPGFALESFDPTGAYREHYLRYEVTDAEKGYGRIAKGAPVDASGETSDGTPFADMHEFKKILAARQDEFAQCLAGKLLAYGLGRDLGFSDRDDVVDILNQTAARGSGLRSLIHAIVQSDVFATR